MKKPDKYLQKYIKLIKSAETDQELSDLIDKIYTDGFEDAENLSKPLNQ